jgi:hypothetical protein
MSTILGRKFGYQKQLRLNACYSVKDIFTNLSLCLYLYVCPGCYLLFCFFPVFIDTIEGMNKRTNERTREGNIAIIKVQLLW